VRRWCRDRDRIALALGQYRGHQPPPGVVDRAIVTAETALTGPEQAFATGAQHLRGMVLAGLFKDRTEAQRHIRTTCRSMTGALVPPTPLPTWWRRLASLFIRGYRLSLSALDCRCTWDSSSLVMMTANSSSASSVAFASRYMTAASSVTSLLEYGVVRHRSVVLDVIPRRGQIQPDDQFPKHLTRSVPDPVRVLVTGL